MGAIAVPADHYWGAQTQRSISNFPFGQRMPLAIAPMLSVSWRLEPVLAALAL